MTVCSAVTLVMTKVQFCGAVPLGQTGDLTGTAVPPSCTVEPSWLPSAAEGVVVLTA